MQSADVDGALEVQARDVVLYYSSPGVARNEAKQCSKASNDYGGWACFPVRIGVYAQAHRVEIAPLVATLRKASTTALSAEMTACIDKAGAPNLPAGLLPIDKPCVAAYATDAYRIAFGR